MNECVCMYVCFMFRGYFTEERNYFLITLVNIVYI